MKKIIFIIAFIWSIFCFSQQKKYFYTELSDLSFTPEVTKNKDGTVTLNSKDSKLDEVFSNYVIYNFECLSPNALNLSLRKTFSLECNDIKLMDELYSDF
jgi:hypothetical protein